MSVTPISPAETGLRNKELAEVQAVLAALSRSPLVARLLSYICQKYFDGEAGRLNELRIAMDVFGRTENFDRHQDSIARVEAHRLRKRLKQYYETDGKDHRVRIELPAGSYIPVFRHVNEVLNAPVAAGVNGNGAEAALPETPSEVKARPTPGRRAQRYAAAGVGATLAILGLVWAARKDTSGTAPSSGKPAGVVSLVPAASEPSGVVRFLCGYSGPPHIGRLGDVWGADRYFSGGGPWATHRGYIRRANDPFIFQSIRTGEFSYDIPVYPGIYELHLYFVETEYGEDLGGGENTRTMQIVLNGAMLFQSFDPLSDAGGPRIADERVFKDVEPASNGKVHIAFRSQRGQPMISAIGLLPGIRHKQLPVRLVTQVNSYTDRAGHVWAPDNYYLGGQFFTDKPPVGGTQDPLMFTSERAGNFSYAIPVDVNGTYGVKLYFAETYFGPEASGVGGVGSRVFNVTTDGMTLLDHFDIFKEAGSLRAIEKNFHGLKPNPAGKLMLNFEPVANYASIFAIEVQDETR
jgi:hypothetical protein